MSDTRLIRRTARQSSGTPPELLLIAQEESEAASLRDIFGDRPEALFACSDVSEALAFLDRRSVGVVLYCADWAECRWQDLLTVLKSLNRPPNLVVASAFADDRTWAEVLNLGAYDLLMMPFNREEVRRVTDAAWRTWHRQNVVAAGA